MGELLQNILSLRNDINKLSEFSNDKAYEYCELAIKIADTEEEIKKIEYTKTELEEDIMDFKLKKGIIFSIPVGGILSIIFFTSLIITCLDNLTIGTILFSIIGTPAFSIAIAFMLSSFLVNSKIFTNFLIKKYEHLKEMNNELNNLIVRNRVTEKSLSNIKKRKEEITNIITNNETVLENKREELNKLEEEYFNNITNNPVTNGTTYTLSTAGKKRTRTRGNDYY